MKEKLRKRKRKIAVRNEGFRIEKWITKLERMKERNLTGKREWRGNEVKG